MWIVIAAAISLLMGSCLGIWFGDFFTGHDGTLAIDADDPSLLSRLNIETDPKDLARKSAISLKVIRVKQ